MYMKPFARFSISSFLILHFSFFISSCTPELDVPSPGPSNIDFYNTIAIGGNYMAGYQDGALYRKGQKLSISALLAKQFALVDGVHFSQYLMPDDKGLGLNSKAWQSSFVTASHLGYITDCKGITSLAPLSNTISVTDANPYLAGIAGNGIQDFSVPFATTPDYFDPAFGKSFSAGNKNPYYNRIASNPGVSTIYDDAVAQYPTFTIAWLGMEDIYNYAAKGGAGAISSSTSFSASVDILLKNLTANGVNKGVIANIPELKSFPYYTTIKWNSLEITQTQADSLNNFYNILSGMPQIHFVAGKNGFIINDANSTGGYRQLHEGEFITLSAPLDSIKCFHYGLLPNPINKYYVLDSSEVAAIDLSINAYNAVIVQKAAQYNMAFVDMHSYFNSVVKGIKWNGTDLNAEFINGGFFSLDGYHPNQKGYSIIANEFIKAINTKYSAAIPTANCVECDGILFP
jgi:hypothetical protein